MKKIRLKARLKCHCDEHYLELCTSFDGQTFTYQRYCYKCGKTWRYTDYLLDNDSYIPRNVMMATDGSTIAVPRMEVTESTIMFDDGTQYYYVYTLNKDGTCGDLIKWVKY